MLGPLGGPELIILLFVAAPFLILWAVSNSTGHSPLHILWGLLGLLGVIIGVIIMLASTPQSRKAVASGYPEPGAGGNFCQQCGAALSYGAAFCGSCGTRVP